MNSELSEVRQQKEHSSAKELLCLFYICNCLTLDNCH